MTLKAVPVLLLLLPVLPSIWGEYLAVNWSDVEALALRHASVHDPGVTPLAPCPCDLTLATCDLNCCCDEDCFGFETTTLMCLEGLQGGQETSKHPEHMCQYWRPYTSAWHDLLCIAIENTPYLGHYYRHEQPVRDFKDYLSRVKQPCHSYRCNNDHIRDQRFYQYYILGSPLETLLITNDSEVRSVLSLPQQLLNGVCIRTLPVYFLEDFSNKCPISLSPSVCNQDPMLSVATYLSDSGYNVEVIGNFNTLETVNISVVYECLSDDILKYIKIHESKNKSYMKFGRRENRHDKECKESKLPYYNASSQTCENAVLSVEYSFGWSGSFIYEIHSKIKLGNIPLGMESSSPSFKILQKGKSTNQNRKLRHINKFKFSTAPKVSLIQHFSVSFHHIGATDMSETVSRNLSTTDRNLTAEGNDTTVEDNYILDLSERSGNPGYQLNRPLLAGYAIYNTTAPDNRSLESEELLYVEVNSTTGFYVWRPGASGDCSLSELERVVFGVDVMSSCLYRWMNTVDCHQLREKLKTVFNSLVQGDVVSKLGWPDVTMENNFLPLIMDDGGTDSRNDSETVSVDGTESVTSDPSTVSDDETVINSDDIDGDVVSSERRCLVPHALEYQVMYQNIAQASFTPAHQLVGVLVRLLYRNIQLSSSASEGWIALTTSAVFLKKPEQSGLTRFWERMEDRWCSGGTCWHELLHPWTHIDAGESSLSTFTVITAHISTLAANTVLLAVLAVPVLVVACCCR